MTKLQEKIKELEFQILLLVQKPPERFKFQQFTGVPKDQLPREQQLWVHEHTVRAFNRFMELKEELILLELLDEETTTIISEKESKTLNDPEARIETGTEI